MPSAGFTLPSKDKILKEVNPSTLSNVVQKLYKTNEKAVESLCNNNVINANHIDDIITVALDKKCWDEEHNECSQPVINAIHLLSSFFSPVLTKPQLQECAKLLALDSLLCTDSIIGIFVDANPDYSINIVSSILLGQDHPTTARISCGEILHDIGLISPAQKDNPYNIRHGHRKKCLASLVKAISEPDVIGNSAEMNGMICWFICDFASPPQTKSLISLDVVSKVKRAFELDLVDESTIGDFGDFCFRCGGEKLVYLYYEDPLIRKCKCCQTPMVLCKIKSDEMSCAEAKKLFAQANKEMQLKNHEKALKILSKVHLLALKTQVSDPNITKSKVLILRANCLLNLNKPFEAMMDLRSACPYLHDPFENAETKEGMQQAKKLIRKMKKRKSKNIFLFTNPKIFVEPELGANFRQKRNEIELKLGSKSKAPTTLNFHNYRIRTFKFAQDQIYDEEGYAQVDKLEFYFPQNFLIYVRESGQLVCWDTKRNTRKLICGFQKDFVNSIFLNPKTGKLYCGGANGQIYGVDLKSERWREKYSPFLEISDHNEKEDKEKENEIAVKLPDPIEIDSEEEEGHSNSNSNSNSEDENIPENPKKKRKKNTIGGFSKEFFHFHSDQVFSLTEKRGISISYSISGSLMLQSKFDGKHLELYGSHKGVSSLDIEFLDSKKPENNEKKENFKKHENLNCIVYVGCGDGGLRAWKILNWKVIQNWSENPKDNSSKDLKFDERLKKLNISQLSEEEKNKLIEENEKMREKLIQENAKLKEQEEKLIFDIKTKEKELETALQVKKTGNSSENEENAETEASETEKFHAEASGFFSCIFLGHSENHVVNGLAISKYFLISSAVEIERRKKQTGGSKKSKKKGQNQKNDEENEDSLVLNSTSGPEKSEIRFWNKKSTQCLCVFKFTREIVSIDLLESFDHNQNLEEEQRFLAIGLIDGSVWIASFFDSENTVQLLENELVLQQQKKEEIKENEKKEEVNLMERIQKELDEAEQEFEINMHYPFFVKCIHALKNSLTKVKWNSHSVLNFDNTPKLELFVGSLGDRCGRVFSFFPPTDYNNEKENQELPKPITFGPETCLNCGKWSAANKRCGNCKRAFYCCKECQRDDWPKHKLKFLPQNLHQAKKKNCKKQTKVEVTEGKTRAKIHFYEETELEKNDPILEQTDIIDETEFVERYSCEIRHFLRVHLFLNGTLANGKAFSFNTSLAFRSLLDKIQTKFCQELFPQSPLTPAASEDYIIRKKLKQLAITSQNNSLLLEDSTSDPVAFQQLQQQQQQILTQAKQLRSRLEKISKSKKPFISESDIKIQLFTLKGGLIESTLEIVHDDVLFVARKGEAFKPPAELPLPMLLMLQPPQTRPMLITIEKRAPYHGFFDKFFKDLYVHLFSFFDHKELGLRISFVCKEWSEIANSEVVWKNLACNTYIWRERRKRELEQKKQVLKYGNSRSFLQSTAAAAAAAASTKERSSSAAHGRKASTSGVQSNVNLSNLSPKSLGIHRKNSKGESNPFNPPISAEDAEIEKYLSSETPTSPSPHHQKNSSNSPTPGFSSSELISEDNLFQSEYAQYQIGTGRFSEKRRRGLSLEDLKKYIFSFKKPPVPFYNSWKSFFRFYILWALRMTWDTSDKGPSTKLRPFVDVSDKEKDKEKEKPSFLNINSSKSPIPSNTSNSDNLFTVFRDDAITYHWETIKSTLGIKIPTEQEKRRSNSGFAQHLLENGGIDNKIAIYEWQILLNKHDTATTNGWWVVFGLETPVFPYKDSTPTTLVGYGKNLGFGFACGNGDTLHCYSETNFRNSQKFTCEPLEPWVSRPWKQGDVIRARLTFFTKPITEIEYVEDPKEYIGGSLEFFINNEPCGQAFRNLSGFLYPAVSLLPKQEIVLIPVDPFFQKINNL